MRSTPPPSQSGSTQTTPSPKGTHPPMQYPTHPSPHSNAAPTHIRENVPSNTRENQRESGNMQHPINQPQHIPNTHSINQPQVNNPPQPPPHSIHQQMNQPPQPQQQPIPNHGRQHDHTPPHVYSAPPPQQQIRQQNVPPQNMQHVSKAQINGDTKPMPQRPSRNVYPSSNPNMGAQQQQYHEQIQPQQKQEVVNCLPTHRNETVKVTLTDLLLIKCFNLIFFTKITE